MDQGYEVVRVPDLTGGAPLSFEAKTLFMLASWIELGELLDGVPFRIASIGDPPDKRLCSVENGRPGQHLRGMPTRIVRHA